MKKIKRPRDTNQLAKLIVDLATGSLGSKKTKSKSLKKHKTSTKKPSASKHR